MVMFYPWLWTFATLIAVSDARPSIYASGDLSCKYEAKSCEECMTEPWYGVQPCAWCMADTGGQYRCGTPSELILEAGCPSNMIKTNTDSKVVSEKRRPFTNRRLVRPVKVKVSLKKYYPVKIPFDVKIPPDITKQTRLKLSVKRNSIPFIVGFHQDEGYKSLKTGRRRMVLTDLKPNDTMSLRVEIESEQCIDLKNHVLKIRIRSTRVSQMKILISQDGCNCNCEKPVVKDTAECGGNGDIRCDICSCHEGYNGPNCKCGPDVNDQCIDPCAPELGYCRGQGTCECGRCKCEYTHGEHCQCRAYKGCAYENKQCGDNGTSVCGHCQCDEGYTGDNCECQDCPRGSNQTCSGHGKCVCGVCSCDEHYSGEACQFTTLTENCLADENGLICGGHGLCENNRCVCDQGYNGPTCEECPYCRGRCNLMRYCATCTRLFQGPGRNKHCQRLCGPVNVVEQLSQDADSYLCTMSQPEGDCSLTYTVSEGTLVANIVSTSDHGLCWCGKCICNPGFSGENCDCQITTFYCMADNGLLCGGNGECVCGKCICSGVGYGGPTCIDTVNRADHRCNEVGSYNDGVCTCQTGRSGPHCECEGDLADYSAACTAPNSTSDELCSERGECVCGYCNCFTRRPNSAQKYSGQYCQCDDYSCPYYNDLLCGGNGVCSCGHCSCMEGYIGDACELSTSNESCIATNGKLCNGVGTCLGSLGCQCDPATSYKGPTCEECPTCPGLCSQFKSCALCVVFGMGDYTLDECEERCRMVTVVHRLDMEAIKRDDSRLCTFENADDCRYYFTYRYTDDGIDVVVQETAVCPSA